MPELKTLTVDNTTFEIVDERARKEILKLKQNGNVSDEQIANAIEDYMEENPIDALSDEQIAEAVRKYIEENEIESGSTVRIGYVTLLANGWEGDNSLYSQVVNIEGVTEHTQVDLTPDVEQLAVFYEKDLTLVTENEGGVVTVYAIGQKPQNDYTIQVTMTEVEYE